MKILYITKNMPFGAAEAFIFAEIEDHLKAGWDVTIAPVQLGPLIHKRGQPLLARTLNQGILSFDILGSFFLGLLTQPFLILSLLFTVITHHNLKVLPRNLVIFPKAVWLGRLTKKMGIEHIHVHWIAVPASVGLIASKIANVPMSITAHRYDIAQNNLIDEKFASSKFVRAIDAPGIEELKAQAKTKITDPIIIRMGVEIAPFEAPSREGTFNLIRAIIGARFVEKKGHETLVRAIAIARDRGVEVSLDIYGDGPLEGHIRGLVDELKLTDLITFKGVASHEDLLGHIRSGRYDVGVLPSVTAKNGDKEGIPVFLMESMAANLPVISTPNGGITELIDGKSGILVPEYDSHALANAFITLANDESLRKSLAKKGFEKVFSEFSIISCARQLREKIVSSA
jgi:colanic acid/amylovoran biosynthesis glycosyltransferase